MEWLYLDGEFEFCGMPMIILARQYSYWSFEDRSGISLWLYCNVSSDENRIIYELYTDSFNWKDISNDISLILHRKIRDHGLLEDSSIDGTLIDSF